MALIFTSCSKEEDGMVNNSEKATLSFSALVNDLANQSSTKQSDAGDIPECSDATPAYVEIVLSQNGSAVVGTTADPFRVNLVAGQVFTEEVPQLELTPGNYSLDHFMVFDAMNNLIWVAPTGGPMATFVDNPLPLNIELGAGVKKYVDVSVLCYDNRNVNEYGYLFFDIDTNEAIEFCVFGNYCDETGRHFAAAYSVDVWSYANGTRGTQIYDDWMNEIDVDANGDVAASPLCIALPDTSGSDEYYFEITLMDGEDYDVTPRIIRAGVVSDTEVRSFFDGENNLEYYHFRSGCENNDNVPILRDPADDAVFYKADLGELNGSDVYGLAYLRLDGNMLESTVLGFNMTPNMVHPQHIHGFGDDSTNSTCPPQSADTNGDGLVDLEEGGPFYGPVILSLYEPVDEFPVANSWGMVTFNRTFHLGVTEFEEEGQNPTAETLLPLVNRAIVLHGAFVGDEYVATLPVACGQVYEISIE